MGERYACGAEWPNCGREVQSLDPDSAEIASFRAVLATNPALAQLEEGLMELVQQKKQKWKRNFKVCRQEKKEEAAMRRKQLIVAGRRWWSRCSSWERIRRGLGSRLCAKFSSKESGPLLRRCQEKKKEERKVKRSKSREKPISSWYYQRQVGIMKALQQVLLSLILFGFGVHMVNTEEQGTLVQQMIEKELCPTRQVENDFR